MSKPWVHFLLGAAVAIVLVRFTPYLDKIADVG